MSATTFVSAFVFIPDSNDIGNQHHKTIDKRIAYFEDIAKTGINICLYSCDYMREKLDTIIQKYDNVKQMEYNYKTCSIYNLSIDTNLNYPINRNETKDTREYMAFMNCKIEFMNHAIQMNPWKTDTFAWLDFSIAYIFREPQTTLQRLIDISKKSCPENRLVIPGCWSKLTEEYVILDTIHWRFCGGFFIGNKSAIQDFYDLYEKYYPIFLQKHNRIVWEVNFWSWLELVSGWNPVWYLADHNDSIFNIPDDDCIFQ